MARKKEKVEEKEEKRKVEEKRAITGELVLKDGNREGKLAIVKLAEEVNIEQDHEANINAINFNGKLEVANPSTVDRLWDINLTLKNVEGINLESNEIKIKELGITDKDNVESKEFQLSGEAQSLLLIKEYINTMPNADDILTKSDIEADLLKLKDKSKRKNTKSAEDKEKYDAAVESSLESYGISIKKINNVNFAIGLYSLFEKPVKEIQLTKTISEKFENTKIIKASIGDTKVEGNKLIWTIDELEPETLALLRFSSDIQIETKDAVKTGTIEGSYKAASSFTGGLEIEKFEAYTNNKHHIDMIEKDDAPGVWDCNFLFENPSEFKIEVYNVDIHPSEKAETKFITIEKENAPILPAGAQWKSDTWQYESEDYPSFRKEVNFKVLAELQADVKGTIAIGEVELVLASITGTVSYKVPGIPVTKAIKGREGEAAEVAPGEEVEVAEKGEILEIKIPSFKETEIEATLSLTNDGSAPLNEIRMTQLNFKDKFKPPNPKDPEHPDQIKLLWDGKEVDLPPDAVRIDKESVHIELDNLKDKPTGMLESGSTIEVKYPIHAESPDKDAQFETDVAYNANTLPLGTELEYIPIPEEIPVLKVVHFRRKYRLGKKIIPIGEFGSYKIIIEYENLGTEPLKNYSIVDKVPDNFKYSEFSMEPEITDEKGTDTLKWKIEDLNEAEKLEISYEINGKGEYRPSDAQLTF